MAAGGEKDSRHRERARPRASSVRRVSAEPPKKRDCRGPSCRLPPPVPPLPPPPAAPDTGTPRPGAGWLCSAPGSVAGVRKRAGTEKPSCPENGASRAGPAPQFTRNPPP